MKPMIINQVMTTITLTMIYVLIQKLKRCLTMNAVMMNIKSYVPFLAQCTYSFSPKNFRKLYSSFKFQRLKKGCIGLKRVKPYMSCSLILIFIFIIISACSNFTSIYSREWKSAQQFARINHLML